MPAHPHGAGKRREGAPYDLRVSIGVARWQPGMNHKDLVGAADQALYEIKRPESP